MITIIMRNAVLSAGIFALSACATSQGKPTAPAPAEPQAKTMPQSGHDNAMPQECKAMMAKMHEKMKSGDMDMAAMKEKMKSGEGMSDQQKTCHKMMHDKMHKAKHDAPAKADAQGEQHAH